MEQVVTLAYLEQMRADLAKQAEQHYANWQATLGAIDLLSHLVDVAKAGTSEPALQLATVADAGEDDE